MGSPAGRAGKRAPSHGNRCETADEAACAQRWHLTNCQAALILLAEKRRYPSLCVVVFWRELYRCSKKKCSSLCCLYILSHTCSDYIVVSYRLTKFLWMYIKKIIHWLRKKKLFTKDLTLWTSLIQYANIHHCYGSWSGRKKIFSGIPAQFIQSGQRTSERGGPGNSLGTRTGKAVMTGFKSRPSSSGLGLCCHH